jgi:hypothetical protein
LEAMKVVREAGGKERTAWEINADLPGLDGV